MLGWLTKEQTIKANIPDKDRSAFSQEKYKFFLLAPFDISQKCCIVTKKKPAKSYPKKMITAQMASESRLRTQVWLKQGCNAFDAKHPISNPMAFWTEQDVLLYVRENNLPIASIYGEIVTDDEENGQMNLMDLGLFDVGNVELHTTLCKREGCTFCGFGLHLEKRPNRLELLDMTGNKNVRDFCLRGGAFQDGLWKPDNRGLGLWFVISWINLAGNFDIYIPEYERYKKEYGTKETAIELQKAKEIGNGSKNQ